MQQLLLILFGVFLVSLSLPSTLAAQTNQFINIVNPVRISTYNPDPLSSLKTQYQAIYSRSLPATWLVTYDVLMRPELVNFLKSFTPNQELGIFLEVTPDLAQASGVKYTQPGSWHFANSLFLSGYTQPDRLKLLDSVFASFKQQFGYYPVSVGSWWTDSYSLAYLADKYSITGTLGLADQFATDNYQVWGQFWSTPFYPSRFHAGLPASSPESKLDVVVLQWAPRDPQAGYQNSLFSTQDYIIQPVAKDTSYFESLVKLYASAHANQFGQVTVGLEADLPAQTYQGEYSLQLDVVRNLTHSRDYQATTIRDFTSWYRSHFPQTSPSHLVQTPSAMWYQSPKYRLGLIDNHIIDLRSYSPQFEPYYSSPNREKTLRINISSLLDSISYPSDTWDIGDAQIQTTPDTFSITGKKISPPPKSIKQHPDIKLTRTSSGYQVKFIPHSTPANGYFFSGWSLETMGLFHSPRQLAKVLIGQNWDKLKIDNYFVSQDELNALTKLATLPRGLVLVANTSCLQCSWHSASRPAVFANLRHYVSRFSHKSIVYDPGILSSTDQKTAKNLLAQTNARYLYLVKFEDYFEQAPFSPGDLNIEKIYENANAQIWIKK